MARYKVLHRLEQLKEIAQLQTQLQALKRFSSGSQAAADHTVNKLKS